MCNYATTAAVLSILFFLHLTRADFTDAQTAILLPRRSAEMYWVNRALPNKFRKYRTYSALQSMAPEEKKRYSEQIQYRLNQLVRQ